jgi:fructose-bisphosphate aldolase class I
MNTRSLKEEQRRKIKTQAGFLAALDQSGGSTPKALANYGIKEGAWSSEEQMYARAYHHQPQFQRRPHSRRDLV